jgi:hypothetical protein
MKVRSTGPESRNANQRENRLDTLQGRESAYFGVAFLGEGITRAGELSQPRGLGPRGRKARERGQTFAVDRQITPASDNRVTASDWSCNGPETMGATGASSVHIAPWIRGAHGRFSRYRYQYLLTRTLRSTLYALSRRVDNGSMQECMTAARPAGRHECHRRRPAGTAMTVASIRRPDRQTQPGKAAKARWRAIEPGEAWGVREAACSAIR